MNNDIPENTTKILLNITRLSVKVVVGIPQKLRVQMVNKNYFVSRAASPNSTFTLTISLNFLLAATQYENPSLKPHQHLRPTPVSLAPVPQSNLERLTSLLSSPTMRARTYTLVSCSRRLPQLICLAKVYQVDGYAISHGLHTCSMVSNIFHFFSKALEPVTYCLL